MKLTVYFDEKPVYLCDKLDPYLEERRHHPEVIFTDELSTQAINSIIHEIELDHFEAGIILYEKLDTLKQKFFHHFSIVEAAGGLVQNEEKALLFIFRKGKWDLPKGKLEVNEDPASCAAREIEEETGVGHLQCHDKIGETHHVYKAFGKHILKPTHWYYFTVQQPSVLKPQAEEDIVECRWIPTKDIQTPVQNTYPNIKDILHKFFDAP